MFVQNAAISLIQRQKDKTGPSNRENLGYALIEILSLSQK
jgi:hypothetical protein